MESTTKKTFRIVAMSVVAMVVLVAAVLVTVNNLVGQGPANPADSGPATSTEEASVKVTGSEGEDPAEALAVGTAVGRGPWLIAVDSITSDSESVKVEATVIYGGSVMDGEAPTVEFRAVQDDESFSPDEPFTLVSELMNDTGLIPPGGRVNIETVIPVDGELSDGWLLEMTPFNGSSPVFYGAGK